MAHLIVDIDIHVFTEGVSFREACGAVLNQVEGLQGAEGRQQLLHLRWEDVFNITQK